MADEPSSSVSTALQVKSYKFEKVASFRNLAIFSSAVSIIFEGSYLSAISPALLSYMSLQDTIFKTALILPVFGILLGTIINFVENFEARLDSRDSYRGSEAERTVRGFWYISMLLIAVVLAYCSYNIFIVEEPISEQMEWFKTAASLFVLPCFAYLLSRYLWQFAVVRHNAEQTGMIASQDLTNLVYFNVVGAFALGLLSGSMKEGTPCKITAGENVFEAHFIVYVGDVTVFKIVDQVAIINSSKIEKMICGR
ncbi:hypothetical protein SAMN04487972_11957 [Paracoccus halophilus]|uniref:Uncharacterized protein n=1 Tax=Paracoccus halophilus TaxID=376733 RepID=A0A1I0U4P8_9RHOB|nr:hypothetical protein [Paracoccus halophilus]SFA58116.1 hypothetical protein SAMN04487972_11957 [Paracoccus halophilus]